MTKKMPQNFSNIDFRPPTLTCKIENNQRTKTDVHNYNASGIQISALALSEPLSENQSPKNIFRGQ